MTRRVRDLIMATRHDADPVGRDQEVLVDIDLHILAAPPERFDEYERQVRAEYAWVPWTLFRRRRVEILSGFSERAPLYHTQECRRSLEAQARINLERSVARLTRK